MSELPLLQVGDDVVFTIAVRDIFATPVDAIVNPANTGLSHGGGLAEIISRMAGEALDNACDALIEQNGVLQTSDAVITTAGLLDFKAVIHTVGPIMGQGSELEKLQLAIDNALHVAEQATPQIKSVAFPMISTGVYCVPKSICAQAFANSLKKYMHSEADNKIKNIWLCVGLDDFDMFASHFDSEVRAIKDSDTKSDIAEFDLSEEALAAGKDKEIDDWFH